VSLAAIADMIPENLSSDERGGHKDERVRRWEEERRTVPKKQNDKREWDGRNEKIRRRRDGERKRETRSDPDSCRFVHVGTEGSPAGSQSNKVVRGCFAGCKFSPCGLSVSILLLLLFPLSFCDCELSLCTSFRDTRKWPCSRYTIYYTLLLLLHISSFRRIIHSNPFQFRSLKNRYYIGYV